MSVSLPSVPELLQAGAHFGHRTSKRHPNMSPYIFGVKDKTHLIDLMQTTTGLQAAVDAVQDLAASGKQILFVATKPQASAIVKEQAERVGMPYMTTRWLGGLLTNWSVVSQGARKLTKLKQQRESGELQKYTKKEQLEFDREIDDLTRDVGGLEILPKLPDAIFVVDVRHEKTAVREAGQMNIPIIAMCDTNVDPLPIAHPIPVNDDAVKSIQLIVSTVADAVAAGLAAPKPVVPITPVTPVADPAAPAAVAAPIEAAPVTSLASDVTPTTPKLQF